MSDFWNLPRLALPLAACFISIPTALASPVPAISPPDPGALSFPELVQRTFFRILELGFFRGILFALLVLGCLVCLAIGLLAGVGTYLRRLDTRLSEKHGEHGAYTTEDGDATTFQKVTIETDGRCIGSVDVQTPRHMSRVISHRTIPIARVDVYNSLNGPQNFEAHFIDPSIHSHRGSSRPSPQDPVRAPPTRLRSALSKSPTSTTRTRFPDIQPLLTGPRRPRHSTSPSPKSVRWADQIQVCMTTMVEMRLERRDSHDITDSELDIGTCRLEKLNS